MSTSKRGTSVKRSKDDDRPKFPISKRIKAVEKIQSHTVVYQKCGLETAMLIFVSKGNVESVGSLVGSVIYFIMSYVLFVHLR